MIIDVLVCRPDGTQEIEKKEIPESEFSNLPIVMVKSNEEKIENLTKQLRQSDEAAIVSFEAQAVTDEAVIALYEK